MNVLVAGGCGFLGSHLCDLLLSKGHFVYCVDNFSTGSLLNLQKHYSNRKLELMKHDITTRLYGLKKLDAILNFASPASPVDYLRLPLETLAVGSKGTKNLLDLAESHGARFLMASTSEIYGDPEVHPQTEKYWGNVNSIGPRSVYDEAKRFSEALVMAYHRKNKLDTKIVRIFNTYGPNMQLNDGRAVPNFMSQALRNEPITIYGDGNQTRSLCYVTDLIAGIYKLLTSDINEPVNIGNPEEVTLLQLATMIKELTNSKSKIVFKKLPIDDPKRRCPDISLAKSKLKWKPKISLKEGLKKTILYFKGKV